MKTNTNQNENSFIMNNNNNNNGDDHMESNKKDIKVLNKKQFKSLTKGQAYNEYESVADIANALKCKADKALEYFKAAQQDALDAQSGFHDVSFRLDKVKAELANTETKLANTETELEEIKIKLAEAEGKIDAGFDLNAEIQNDLDDLIKNRDEEMESYNRLGARMTGKRARANINMGTIRHYKNIIHQCKKDIENGKDVEGNKATIFELEAEIRNLQRQVDAANGTFNEMKRNKTGISQKIVKMENELDKRYQLNNLLGELGYM